MYSSLTEDMLTFCGCWTRYGLWASSGAAGSVSFLRPAPVHSTNGQTPWRDLSVRVSLPIPRGSPRQSCPAMRSDPIANSVRWSDTWARIAGWRKRIVLGNSCTSPRLSPSAVSSVAQYQLFVPWTTLPGWPASARQSAAINKRPPPSARAAQSSCHAIHFAIP